MTTEPVITYTYVGGTPEESGKFYATAHAWQDFITETIDEDMARLWLEAYDHATEHWEYDMPNPLDVWEEFYLPTTQLHATTDDHEGDHTHDHTRADDHTRAQAHAHVGADRYAWARAYASAYRDATAKLMRGILEKGYVEPLTQDNNSRTGTHGA